MKDNIYILIKDSQDRALPKLKSIRNTLEDLQKEVKGYIQVIPMRHNVAMIVNEEGLLNNMEYNFTYKHHNIYGPVVFLSFTEDMEGFEQLSFKQIEYIHDIFEVLN